jgi:hypothetical protein
MAIQTNHTLSSGVDTSYIKIDGAKLYQNHGTLIISFYKDQTTRNETNTPITTERQSISFSESKNAVLFWVLYRMFKLDKFPNGADVLEEGQETSIENLARFLTDDELAWAPTVIQQEVERRAE